MIIKKTEDDLSFLESTMQGNDSHNIDLSKCESASVDRNS